MLVAEVTGDGVLDVVAGTSAADRLEDGSRIPDTGASYVRAGGASGARAPTARLTVS